MGGALETTSASYFPGYVEFCQIPVMPLYQEELEYESGRLGIVLVSNKIKWLGIGTAIDS
ncbi:hypothetical protein [Bacillus marinisedimentorum]|uniref:hypothetical protein n=1 Tax=Bacillus marinisedimentorum TaxID=1821260 RepID=UPI000872D5C6|nr:hypothetical protein [Bacillus marinisedimentorum]